MEDDVMRMQQEAARRVQRTQEQNRRVWEAHQGRTAASMEAARTPGWPGANTPLRSPGLYSRSESPAEQTADSFCAAQTVDSSPSAQTTGYSPAPRASGRSAGSPSSGILSGDPEQWLLLGLALLLFRSGCRPELTLALLYLAM